MSQKEVATRWVKWTVRREGKEQSSWDDSYHYDNNILYHDNNPVSRMMPVNGGVVQLSKHGHYASNLKGWKEDGGPKIIDSIYVPCIGAFSRFPIDVLPDEQLHPRLHMLWRAWAQWNIDYANSRPIQNFVLGYGSASALKSMVSEVEAIGRRYDQYRRTFGLKWDPFDTEHFTSKITAIVQWRLSEYYSPANTQKRERQQARREAKKAFDLK